MLDIVLSRDQLKNRYHCHNDILCNYRYDKYESRYLMHIYKFNYMGIGGCEHEANVNGFFKL